MVLNFKRIPGPDTSVDKAIYLIFKQHWLLAVTLKLSSFSLIKLFHTLHTVDIVLCDFMFAHKCMGCYEITENINDEKKGLFSDKLLLYLLTYSRWEWSSFYIPLFLPWSL